jgi:diguanylate cyclase (GGDEF)-like protein/putative nucleotidyltransferase with HDIG domain
MPPEQALSHVARTRARIPVAPPAPPLGNGTATSRDSGEREVLTRVAAAAAAATGLQDVIELAAEAALEVLDAGSLAVSRWERESDTMRVLINVGVLGPGEARFPEEEVYALADFPKVRKLLHSATPYFTAVDDPDADPAGVALLKQLGKESDLAVPIVVDGEVWGEVWASTCPGAPRFRASDVRFLAAIAGQLAGVIGRAEHFSNVSRLAYEDELTGLANRRAFEERLEKATARWKDHLTPVTLLVCDVDELKAINDARGHHAGDRALKRVAEALLAACAPFPTAFPARLSGDEFAVLLEGHHLEEARDVATTVLRLLREDRDIPLTVSCGGAGAGPGIDRPDQLLRAADTAQYAAKQRGGGQFCTAETTPTPQIVSGERRRSRRRGAIERLDETSARMLQMLDTELSGRSTLDRLEIVVAGFAEAVNAAGWTISFSAEGSATIQSICSSDDRDNRLRGIRVGLADEVYRLADYPQTARIVEQRGGSFHVDVDDRDSDRAERDLLADLGFSSVVGAAAPDAAGVYLVELYADGATGDLAAAELRVQLLARAATGRSADTEARQRQLTKRTRHLALTGALGAKLAAMVDEESIVEAVVDALADEFGCTLTAIVKETGDGEVELVAARGGSGDRLLKLGWRQPSSLGLIGRSLREREVVMVGDVRLEPDYRVTQVTEEVRSELCAPLSGGESIWGAIDLESGHVDAFDEDDARLVSTVAAQASAALRSARLFSQLELAYLNTAEALAAGLEAKDSYTASHSRSIAEHAEAVGRALGMDSAELRTLRFGAAFHDIGKLAIPESILNKNGPLTADERARIEQHTVIGEQILAPIDFLVDVRPIIRHGHERWDGDGYPDGLAGEEIPLGARIVFACDAYDAMTTDRPYRRALAPADARRELRRGAGTQFDPDVVAALLKVLGD